MSIEYIQVPFSLGGKSVLALSRQLAELPEAESYEIDFSKTQHMETFGMLITAAAIRRLSERITRSRSRVTVRLVGKCLDKPAHKFAERMGFWWSIDDRENLHLVKRAPSDNTVPITRLGIDELYRRSGGVDPVRSGAVENAAGAIATALCGDSKDLVLWYTLTYSFREMFRNVIEHSRADSIWYAATTRPSADDIQVAIMDGGDGIRKALSENPDQVHDSDEKAIRAATLPGVSGKAHKVRSQAQTQQLIEDFPDQSPELYDNSGYGLTIIKELAAVAGELTIASGTTAIYYKSNRFSVSDIVSQVNHKGTAIRLVLHPSRLEGALDRAISNADRNRKCAGPGTPLLSASMQARLGLRQMPGTHTK